MKVSDLGQLPGFSQHSSLEVEVERFAFYERAKKAYVVVATGEKGTAIAGLVLGVLTRCFGCVDALNLPCLTWHCLAFYANLILKKGIIGDDGK